MDSWYVHSSTSIPPLNFVHHIVAILTFLRQRIFSYGSASDYALGFVGIVGAVGAGVALAMLTVVLGSFITVLSDFSTGNGQSGQFMKDVSKNS